MWHLCLFHVSLSHRSDVFICSYFLLSVAEASVDSLCPIDTDNRLLQQLICCAEVRKYAGSELVSSTLCFFFSRKLCLSLFSLTLNAFEERLSHPYPHLYHSSLLALFCDCRLFSPHPHCGRSEQL